MQIDLGQGKAVQGPGDGIEAHPCRSGLHVGHEQAERAFAAAPDPAAELVQLAHAEPVGVHDDHDRGVGYVDSDLDDRRRDEHVDRSLGEPAHDVVLGLRRELAVQHLHPESVERPLGQLGGQVEDRHGRFAGLRVVVLRRRAVAVGAAVATAVAADPGADDVGLASGRDLLPDARHHPTHEHRVVGRHDVGGDGGPALGQLGERRRLEVAEHRHRDRPWDGRRRHDQDVRRSLVTLARPGSPGPPAARRRTCAARPRRRGRGRGTAHVPPAARACR